VKLNFLADYQHYSRKDKIPQYVIGDKCYRIPFMSYKKTITHMAWTRLKNVRQETAKTVIRVDDTRKDERGRRGFAAGEINL
jgi:hypothetical protein